MLLKAIKHSSRLLQPMLGGLTFWSAICVFNTAINSDREYVKGFN